MNQALFESITGTFLDGTVIDAIPQKQRLIQSIIDHLTRIFNTREGSISHLKGYGLPDITDIYQKLPDGVELLKTAIKKTIEQYEPRLKNVKVTLQEQNLVESRLVFMLSVEVKNMGVVRFQTTFFHNGQSKISPWKKLV